MSKTYLDVSNLSFKQLKCSNHRRIRLTTESFKVQQIFLFTVKDITIESGQSQFETHFKLPH